MILDFRMGYPPVVAFIDQELEYARAAVTPVRPRVKVGKTAVQARELDRAATRSLPLPAAKPAYKDPPYIAKFDEPRVQKPVTVDVTVTVSDLVNTDILKEIYTYPGIPLIYSTTAVPVKKSTTSSAPKPAPAPKPVQDRNERMEQAKRIGIQYISTFGKAAFMKELEEVDFDATRLSDLENSTLSEFITRMVNKLSPDDF